MNKSFQTIYDLACKKHGGEAALLAELPDILSSEELSAIGDDRYLSAMAQGIFSAGFVWRVVANKMPGFEEVFWNFDVEKIAYMPPEMLEDLAQDKRIVRNLQKVKATYENSIFMTDIAKEHGSFANFVAQWPSDNIIGLWDIFKKRGSRLGGMTGPYFLRRMGKDCWLPTGDVVAALHNNKVIDSPKATSKAALKTIQEQMNEWHENTGLPYSHISRVLAFSIG